MGIIYIKFKIIFLNKYLVYLVSFFLKGFLSMINIIIRGVNFFCFLFRWFDRCCWYYYYIVYIYNFVILDYVFFELSFFY